MLRYTIKTIPHKDQRYETVGDYFKIKGENIITVSDMKNRDYEFLVALHELVESYLCESYGVSEKKITAFDMAFEKKRKKGNTDEAGDDNVAPYRDAHCVATGVERMMAGLLCVSWKDYEKAVNELCRTK